MNLDFEYHKQEMENGSLKIWQTIIIMALVIIFGVLSSFSILIENKLDKIQYQKDDIQILGMSNGAELFETPVVNVLLIGTDERTEEFSDQARADSIMIGSLNTSAEKIKLSSLERGIAVPIENQEDDWLTHTFAYGGAELLLNTVREQFDLDVSHYVRVNFYAFEKIVDAFGGVNIKLTSDEVKALNPLVEQSLYTGYNKLNGYSALEYSRLRSIDSDFNRVERQRNVIEAAIKKAGKLSVFEILKLMDEVLPMVQTNFTKSEIRQLAIKGYGYLGSPVEQITVPEHSEMLEGTYTSDGRILTRIDFEEASKRLKDFIYEDVQ